MGTVACRQTEPPKPDCRTSSPNKFFKLYALCERNRPHAVSAGVNDILQSTESSGLKSSRSDMKCDGLHQFSTGHGMTVWHDSCVNSGVLRASFLVTPPNMKIHGPSWTMVSPTIGQSKRCFASISSGDAQPTHRFVRDFRGQNGSPGLCSCNAAVPKTHF